MEAMIQITTVATLNLIFQSAGALPMNMMRALQIHFKQIDQRQDLIVECATQDWNHHTAERGDFISISLFK